MKNYSELLFGGISSVLLWICKKQRQCDLQLDTDIEKFMCHVNIQHCVRYIIKCFKFSNLL